MIVLNAGNPGGGKSYDAVQKIIINLKNGRHVCTNIDGMDIEKHQEMMRFLTGLDEFEFKRLFKFLTVDQVKNFFGSEVVGARENDDGISEEIYDLVCPLGSLIVIDEVHKYFNSHDYRSEGNRALADWASTHRHDGYDCVFITQRTSKLEKNVRELAEYTYFFRKINFLGSLVQNGYIIYSYEGDDDSGVPLGSVKRFYKKEVFRCYKSFNSDAVKEVAFMKHFNALRHPILYLLPVVLGLFIWRFSSSSFAKGEIIPKAKVPVVSRSAPLPIQRPISSARMLPAAGPAPIVFRNLSGASVAPAFQEQKRQSKTGYIWTGANGQPHITNMKETIPHGVKYREL